MSGHLDGPPPGPPDPPYIPGDLGAPSAEEFARRRGDVVQCSQCGQFSPPVPVVDDVAAAWVEAECENERLRAERDAALAAGAAAVRDTVAEIVTGLRERHEEAQATMSDPTPADGLRAAADLIEQRYGGTADE